MKIRSNVPVSPLGSARHRRAKTWLATGLFALALAGCGDSEGGGSSGSGGAPDDGVGGEFVGDGGVGGSGAGNGSVGGAGGAGLVGQGADGGVGGVGGDDGKGGMGGLPATLGPCGEDDLGDLDGGLKEFAVPLEISYCIDDPFTRSGMLDGKDDVDWYVYSAGPTEGCMSVPSAELSAEAKLSVCMYVKCTGNEDIECPFGTTPSEVDGIPGCCGTGDVSIPSVFKACSGKTEISMSVSKPIQTDECIAYDLDYIYSVPGFTIGQ